MNSRLWDRRTRSKSSIAISLAFHVVAIAGLLSITFQYPIADFLSKPEPIKAVPVRYIALTPKAAGGPASATPSRARANPASALPKVSSIPVGIPAPPAPTASSGVAIGAGGSTAASGRDQGIGFGLRPGIPDGRLATNPAAMARRPLTEGQLAERALAAIYDQYLDSARAAMARPGREAGDWSWGGKDGEKWGWDKNGIHVGGITIPNIVLAALPIPVTSNTSPIEARTRDFIRSDIQSHAGLMSEDEFRAAVRRVRERVDRERSERLAREKEKASKTPPCCES